MRKQASGIMPRPPALSGLSVAKSTDIGREKEDQACRYLADREGYEIIGRNYRCRYGEIDIIALEENVLIFVEVRYRRQGGLVSAIESVDKKKAQRLRLAVRSYLSEHRHDLLEGQALRVDLCVIRDGQPAYELLKGIIDF